MAIDHAKHAAAAKASVAHEVRYHSGGEVYDQVVKPRSEKGDTYPGVDKVFKSRDKMPRIKDTYDRSGETRAEKI